MKTTSLNRRNIIKLITFGSAASLLLPQRANAEVSALNDDIKPVYIPPGEGEKYKIATGEITFKLSKAQTLANLGSSEVILNPGVLGAPPHFHKTFDEICIVQEGTLHVLVGEEVFEVAAGGWHLRPRGMVHTFWNSGNVPVKYIEIYTPGGFEEYLKALDKLFENGAKPKTDAIDALVKQYDIILRFDLLQGIVSKYNVHMG